MIALACPTIDAAGQLAGFASNVAAAHAFCSVVRREGSSLGKLDFDAGDVRVVPLGAVEGPFGLVRVGQLHREARPARPTGLTGGGDREFGRELQARAVGDLERHFDRGGRAFGAVDRPGDLLRIAVGRVEREPGAVDQDVDVLDLQREPFEDVRDRVFAASVGRDRQRRRVGVDFDLRANHDRAAFLQIERARFRRVDDAQAERGAPVGAGDVDLPAGDRERVPADTDGDDRFPDLAGWAARPRVRLRFAAQRHPESRPERPAG